MRAAESRSHGGRTGPRRHHEPGFDNFAGLQAAGWVFTNNSSNAGLPWFAGNSGVFGAQAGAAGSHAAASFLSTNSDTDTIDNRLIIPVFAPRKQPDAELLHPKRGRGLL